MTATDHEWAVDVQDLRKAFGDFVAVGGVTFRVRRGEVFGFLGPNGAGKSTVIRILCGLLQPSGGRAFICGLDSSAQSDAVRGSIGYMSQKFSLYQDLTVEENLDFFGGVYGVPRRTRNERKEFALRTTGLSGQTEIMARDLAGGWTQRLALACAIVHDPPVLILDEPTSGVDPMARRDFWDVIHDLADTGRTVFVTTHYMDEAEYCDRLALMNAGRLIATGAPRELKTGIGSYAVLRLFATDSMAALRAIEEEVEGADVTVFGAGLHVTVRDRVPEETKIRAVLQRRGIAITALEQVEPSMEDVFKAFIDAAETQGR